MASEQTIILTRNEYDALLERKSELEDRLAALEADDGVRVPHEVALAIINGKKPIVDFRNHQGITLQELSKRIRLAVGYLSEIKRGLKPGSVSAMARIASALGTMIDVLLSE
ncbi:MAG: helix-turn-helix transcriptional regulator [Caldilineaceae bacterium SB0664_bin_22]|nr:helix-turn-helix transcriptional regulator [Caldilineaceae bacterium SB0664_bin_22]